MTQETSAIWVVSSSTGCSGATSSWESCRHRHRGDPGGSATAHPDAAGAHVTPEPPGIPGKAWETPTTGGNRGGLVEFALIGFSMTFWRILSSFLYEFSIWRTGQILIHSYTTGHLIHYLHVAYILDDFW